MNDRERLYVQRAPTVKGFSVHVLRPWRPGVGETAKVVTGMEWSDHEDGDFLPAAPLTLGEQAVQELMDDLWREGVRPTQVGTAGHLEALQKHADYLESLVQDVLPSALRTPTP